MHMLKIFFTVLVAIHALIHFTGFASAYGIGPMKGKTGSLSKKAGIAWLVAGFLFLTTAICLLSITSLWILPALIAIILSQTLIVMHWHKARYGTIVNIIILIATVVAYGSYQFEKKFLNDVQKHRKQAQKKPIETLTTTHLQYLPVAVRQYIIYTGAVGRPIVHNARICFTGTMRQKGKDWFPFTSEQYNFFEDPARLFFIKGRMYGVSVPGYHTYQYNKAAMQVKLFGWYPVVNINNRQLFEAETVTLFNDMCLLAPATLISKSIQWQQTNGDTVKAIFTNKGICISAQLIFNKQGQLVNFISADRTDINTMNRYIFSTPVGRYKNINGYYLPTYGEAIWHYPYGKFVYGIFNLQSVTYNVNR